MPSPSEPGAGAGRPCPICSSVRREKICDLTFAVFDDCPVSGRFPLVCCGACGFGFYDTWSSQADFDRYYRGNAYYASAVTAGAGGEADRRRFGTQVDRLAPYVPGPESLIVDVGCGQGGLLSELRDRGHAAVMGVDLLPDNVAHIRDGRGLPAAVGSAGDLPPPVVEVDCMVYSHVLEHVLDPGGAVACAARRLAPGGVVYAEVPDATAYGSAGAPPLHELYLEHVNHFGRRALVDLFRPSGLSPVELGQAPLPAADGTVVPCLYGVFRKGSIDPAPLDDGLPAALREYVERSDSHPLMGRLQRLADSGVPLYLWGVSQHAMLLLGRTALGRCRLAGLIDRDPFKQTKTVGGLPVSPPEVLADAPPGAAVLVAANGYRAQIAAELRALEFPGEVVTLS